LRAFVALEVPAHVLDLLVSFQKEIMATGADLKLVERENLHFTVKFLGEISEAQAAEVESRLGKLSLKAVDVEVRGAGAFPSPVRPRVVWAGVPREHEGLVAPLANEVIASLEGIGERDDRPFHAHITLARVRSGLNSRHLQDLLGNNSERSFGSVKLAELKLKSSTLTSSGPIYRDIGAYHLS
jgi:2'-5' RNA ligase